LFFFFFFFSVEHRVVFIVSMKESIVCVAS